jgi:Copper type II ascorbate-dependent monooxygenase, C-terminal domain
MAMRSGAPFFTVLFLSAVLSGAACGGDDDGDDGGGEVDGGDDGGGADAGAGGEDDGNGGGGGAGGECEEEPCLAAPEQGFQMRSVGTEIEPGEDVEYCEVVELPGEPGTEFYVNRFESEMTTGSHHLIVSAIEPGSQTDQNAKVGDRVPCVGPASAFGGDLLDVTGQQIPYHEESYPEGVGHVYTAGQKVIFNYHYFNATDAPLQARAAVNFFTTDEANVDKIAESFSALYAGLFVPQGETASFNLECRMEQDVMVHKLTRHTHQWGTDFPVYFAGGERDGELIYTSPNYEEPDHVFEQPVLVKAGEGFRFQCNYDNTDGDHDLTFGENATDEMCILFATIYSPDGREVKGEESCFLFSESPPPAE